MTKVSTIPTSRIFTLSIMISDDFEPLYSKKILQQNITSIHGVIARFHFGDSNSVIRFKRPDDNWRC